MRQTPILLLAAVLGLLALLPAQATAAKLNVRVGIGDQHAPMFDNPAFQRLQIKRVRYFIPWNAMGDPGRLVPAEAYVRRARAAGASVLLHISSDNLARKQARLPSKSRYRREVTRLVRHFRSMGVREFGARNEANHDSQATYRSPRRAAYEYRTVRRAAGSRSTVIALDVLDQRGVERYIARFYRALGRRDRRRATLVGIHNYSDVNRRRTSGTRSIMRAVRRYNRRATFWLTETGGIVKFGRSFPYSPRRAANRLNYLFGIVKRYRRSIKRVYVYNWTGAQPDERFDAGLTNPDGSVRTAYRVLRKQLRRYKR